MMKNLPHTCCCRAASSVLSLHCCCCCSQGVPHQLRGWVWWQTSGAAKAAAAAPSGHFEACLQQGQGLHALKQIELVRGSERSCLAQPAICMDSSHVWHHVQQFGAQRLYRLLSQQLCSCRLRSSKRHKGHTIHHTYTAVFTYCVLLCCMPLAGPAAHLPPPPLAGTA